MLSIDGRSSNISDDDDDKKDRELFFRITKVVYDDLRTPRIRFLFKALIRLMMKYEIEGARKLETVFDAGKGSKVARLVQIFSLHPSNWVLSYIFRRISFRN